MSRILVVEDEQDLAIGLADDLRVEGYDVEVASDGETVARRAREAGWNLILLDIMLPRKDGLEVCRELRRSGIRTPIIMVTAKTEEAERVRKLRRWPPSVFLSCPMAGCCTVSDTAGATGRRMSFSNPWSLWPSSRLWFRRPGLIS